MITPSQGQFVGESASLSLALPIAYHLVPWVLVLFFATEVSRQCLLATHALSLSTTVIRSFFGQATGTPATVYTGISISTCWIYGRHLLWLR